MSDPASPKPPRGQVRPPRLIRFFTAQADQSIALRALGGVNRTYWLIALYIGGWILLRAGGVGGPPFTHTNRVGIAVVFLLEMVNLALRTRTSIRRGGIGRSHPSRVGWVFTTLDLVLITLGLRLTGGIDSGLWPVLIFAVAAETVLERTPESWVVRGGATVAMIAAMAPWPLQGGAWLLELTTRLVFLYAVSSITRRLRETNASEEADLAALRAELALTSQRGMLSREVHDGVGNSLAASVLRLEFAARVAEKQGGEEAEATSSMLREEAQSLRQAMSTVRDWTFFSRPWSPDALVHEVERLSRRTNLPMRITGTELLETLSANTTTGLTVVRIAQEALTNAAKHAEGATQVVVNLVRDSGGWLTLTVTDDGRGLRNTGTGIGMVSMQERAEGAGGTLTVHSEPGQGVTIVARFPSG